MEVSIISKTEDLEYTCIVAARTCYNSFAKSDSHLNSKIDEGDSNILIGENDKQLIKNLLLSKHYSVFEHGNITFSIKKISRACLTQLTRHRHFSFSVQSQRYVEQDIEEFYIPESIKKNVVIEKEYRRAMVDMYDLYTTWIEDGILKEDARMILPNACFTNLILTANCRALIEFFEKRICKQAQREIYELAFFMRERCIEVAPNIFSF